MKDLTISVTEDQSHKIPCMEYMEWLEHAWKIEDIKLLSINYETW